MAAGEAWDGVSIVPGGWRLIVTCRMLGDQTLKIYAPHLQLIIIKDRLKK